MIKNNSREHTPQLQKMIQEKRDNQAIIESLHTWIDITMLQIKNQIDVTCEKACAHCCRGSKIIINMTEAKVLASYSKKNALLNPSLDKNDFHGVPCPFLNIETELCTVYECRPATCRTAMSIDDPQKCISEENRQMVTPLNIYLDLKSQLGDANYRTITTAQGQEADIRAFFPFG
jgi:Fe-S-cluster containining protein